MASNHSNFNFCPICYDEGCRFLKVTDGQKESVDKYYKGELKKKDELIYLLHKSLDTLKGGYEEAMENQRMEYEANLSKREDIITSLQNARQNDQVLGKCDSKKVNELASKYIQNARARAGLRAAKENNNLECDTDSVLKEVGNIEATANTPIRRNIHQFDEKSSN